MTLPPGVEEFTPEASASAARKNVIVMAHGASKTGKTHFAVRGERPLYVAYLDPNQNLDYHLLKAQEEFPGEVFKLVITPLEYDQLTQEEAQTRWDNVVKFARWAINSARERVGKGEPGGTFVLDGATMFKGYVEKALLGQSATLGWRAARGERGGPTPFDYARSNAKVREFIQMFSGAPLDVVLVWEGRRLYRDDGTGRSVATDQFKTSMPDVAIFATNAMVETLRAKEDVVENNRKVGETIKPMIRIGENAYNMNMQGRMMPALGFAALKRLFLVDVPQNREEEVLVDPSTVEPMDSGGIGE